MANGLMGLTIGTALGVGLAYLLIKQGIIPNPIPTRIVSIPAPAQRKNDLIRVDI